MPVATLPFPETPPLESGDRLSREQFHGRFASMPHLKKAELIEGIVYMPSPVSLIHSAAHKDIVAWLAVYAAGAAGVQAGDNATVILDDQNELQPDAFLRLLPENGGQSRMNDEGYLEGCPDLVAEISLSSASIDLREKKQVYLRNNVKEYVVWLVLDRKFYWWKNQASRFEPISTDHNGIARSSVFEGLRLNIPALLEGNLASVLESLR